MLTALSTLATIYVVSLAFLMAMQMSPSIPGMFIVGIVLLFVPLAYLITELLSAIDVSLDRFGRGKQLVTAALGLIGLTLCALLPASWYLTVFILIACLIHMLLLRREILRPVAVCGLALVLLFGAVWNLNQAMGPITLQRLHDQSMIEIELGIYGFFFGHPVEPTALFPWFSSPQLFAVVETAYFFLFSELFVVIFVLAKKRVSAARFFTTSATAYLIGLIVFYFFPIVGPVCTEPAMLAEEFHHTRTYELTLLQAGSYSDLIAGRPCRGFAYLVALPSLHVAMAIIMQRFLAISPVHFWALLPTNLLMIVATVYLGFHYLIDVAAGALLAVIALVIPVVYSAGVKSLQARLSLRPMRCS